MNYLMVGISLLMTSLLSAATPVGTVVDMLRETPASTVGNISMDTPMKIWEDKSGLINYGLRIKPKQDIGYSFSDKHISINTEKAIELTVQGVPIKVKSIYYHEQSGKFEVKADLPLGIGEKALNAHLSKKITELYKPKVQKAFAELKSLRAKKNLSDINSVISSITSIFTTSTVPLPTIRGSMDLVFTPQQNKTLKLDQWSAQIKKDDYISAGMDFVRKNGKIAVTGLELRSQKGIRITGKTKYPEIASINFSSLRADGTGIHFNYDIGAEEVIAGFRLVLNVVKAYAGHPGDVTKECDPVRLEAIRKSIDGNLRREIAQMIRLHRKTLTGNGISPQLLAVLD